jgi:hypothetical protein
MRRAILEFYQATAVSPERIVNKRWALPRLMALVSARSVAVTMLASRPTP